MAPMFKIEVIMKELIDKAVVVAELDKLYDLEYDNTSDLSCGKKIMLRHILLFLDTLEVKEVDLEKEMDFVKDAYYYFTSDERDSMMKVARHFFELGLKAKGE